MDQLLIFALRLLTFNLFILLILITRIGFAVTISEIAPVNSRPFLLPESEQQYIKKLIENEDWAKKNYRQLIEKARQGDGYSAAFLYALNQQPEFLSIAKDWLLKLAKQGGDLGERAVTANEKFYNQGMPWLGDVYYKINSKHLQAYDLIYNGLTAPEREELETGLKISAVFRKNAMDTWWQTPNLVFKPTSMVALHGLLTQDEELINWGFFRKPNSSLGGYFPALTHMLKDNGPWNEAPIYAALHQPLSLSLEISDYLSRATGRDWFSRKLDNGNSVKGLMDYYINTTYPAETRPNGEKVFRLLTYGDGATGQKGDTFLVSDNPYQPNLKTELTRAYKLSHDPGYAAFLKRFDDYSADLMTHPKLPYAPLLPGAPSSIWPNFGLAFLRSNQTPEYWNDPDSIAASLLFRQGYGHGHSDALSITLFAQGRLFYPDYNAIQYENPALGWTASSIAHNTVVVDEGNSTIPKHVDHSHWFTNTVKVAKAMVTEPLGIDKSRTLALTREYLLDIFHLKSLIPRDYDYLLHSFARIQTEAESTYQSAAPLGHRYHAVQNFKLAAHDNNWKVDFIYDLDQELKRTNQLIADRVKGNNFASLEQAFGVNDSQHFNTSTLSVEMAAQANTQVGIGQDEFGLSFMVARREKTKQTTFVALHSPDAVDKIANELKLTTLVDSQSGSLIRVESTDYIDIHAVSFVDNKIKLTDPVTGSIVEFTDYAFLRMNKTNRQIEQQGEWDNYLLGRELLNINEDLVHGLPDISTREQNQIIDVPVQIDTYPELILLKNFEDTEFTLSITNLTDQTLFVTAQLGENPNYPIPELIHELGLINPFRTYTKKISLGRYQQASGIDVLPIRIFLNQSTQAIEHGILVSAGPGLTEIYSNVDEPVYRINTFNSSVDYSMRHGLVQQIEDSEGNKIYSGHSLFDFSEGKTMFKATNDTIYSSHTWPNKQHAGLISEINNLIRWHVYTIQDQFYLKLDDTYTRVDQVQVNFLKSNPNFLWNEVSYLSEQQQKRLADTTAAFISTHAIELPLKDSAYSVCVKSPTVRDWSNGESAIAMPVYRNKNEQWSFALCEKHSLVQWAN